MRRCRGALLPLLYTAVASAETTIGSVAALHAALRTASTDGNPASILLEDQSDSADGLYTLASPLQVYGTHVSIRSNGAVLSGGMVSRHFDVAAGAKLELRGLRLEHGRGVPSGGSIEARGGADVVLRARMSGVARARSDARARPTRHRPIFGLQNKHVDRAL